MKRKLSTFLVLVMVLSQFNNTNAVINSSCYSKVETISYSGGSKVVNSVWVNLNDPTIRLEVVCANDLVGTTAPMKEIAASAANEETKVLAAINGGFFNAYEDLQPAGTLQVQGETLFFDTGVHFGVDANNQPMMLPLKLTIEGATNGSWEYPNNFDAWNLNYNYSNPLATAIFTPAYGKKTPSHEVTSIVVDKKVVTKIVSGQADIPSEGYVIVTGNTGQIAKFMVGTSVDYRLKYALYDFKTKSISDAVDFTQIRSGVSAGPTLVSNSIIVVDPVLEGFTEAKITTTRAQRSFIGTTKDLQMVMGVVSNVNLEELAEICKNMGLEEAMNLDGGGSSGLMINGTYILQPGRNLSNIIAVTQLEKRPIRVTLNGKDIFFDQDAYQDSKSGRVMVPMRKIFETLGATVSWSGIDNSVTAVKDNTTIKIKVGSDQAIVNGKAYQLEQAVASRGERTFVPVRFITEQFGGTVGWVETNRLVTLTISGVDLDAIYTQGVALQKQGNLSEAKDKYLELLAVNPAYIDALKALITIFNTEKNYEKAIIYYEKILELDPKNYDLWGSLGWAYYTYAYSDWDNEGLAHLYQARDAFAEQIILDSKKVSGYYGVGLICADGHVNEVEKAKDHFKIALTLNPSVANKSYMEKYIAAN